MIHKDFGLNEPQDSRKLSCCDCGIMDASVKRTNEGHLCEDCRYRREEMSGFDINDYGSR